MRTGQRPYNSKVHSRIVDRQEIYHLAAGAMGRQGIQTDRLAQKMRRRMADFITACMDEIEDLPPHT